MAWHLKKLRFAVCGLLSVLTLGCSSTVGGMAGLEAFPDGGQYEGTKNDNIVNVRLSSAGVNYLNNDWRGLVEAFAPGQVLKIPFPCTTSKFPVIGDVAIGDQGSAGCSSESCGNLDGKCDWKDVPREIEARILDFALNPQPSDGLSASLTLELKTGKIFVDTVDRSHGGCLWAGAVKCSVEFDSTRKAPSSNSIAAIVKFKLNQTWDNLISFDVTSIDGATICGASGAGAPPACLEPDDLDISRENFCAIATCSLSDWGLVKDFVLQRISPLLESQVRAAIDQQSCRSCGAGKPSCPQTLGATSSCKSDICVDDATQECVPRVLGLEGRLNPSAPLASYGVPPSSRIDLSVGLGSSFVVDQGLSLGTRGGLKAVAVNDCVPKLSPPSFRTVPAPAFDAEAPPAGYHVGLGISSPFLEQALYEAHQSGALCLGIQSATIGQVNTGLFKTFLPSLGRLATRDGKDAPMMIVLRPAKAPTVKLGAGSVDPATQKPIDALITLGLKDLTLDFYATFDDRQARLFSLTADVSLPLSLIIQGCSSVQPAIGDVRQLVTNIRTSNSEMLAEDPKILADLIPAVIGLAEPALAQALSPYSLPDFGSFKLRITSAKGLGLDAASKSYNHLGLYAQLVPASASCVQSGPSLRALLLRSEVPPRNEQRAVTASLAIPRAILNVESLGAKGPFEYTYRIDQGLWHEYQDVPSNLMEISHPLFLLQGTHDIQVRSRLKGIPGSDSSVVSVPFVIDWESPVVSLHVNKVQNRIEVLAYDNMTPKENLEYAYRLGQGSLSLFGPPRMIDLATVEAEGGLWVEVRDAQGNIGTNHYRVAATGDRSLDSEIVSEAPTGCSSTAGNTFACVALLMAFGTIRMRRNAS